MVAATAPLSTEHQRHRRHHEPGKDYIVRPGHEALFHARDAQIPKSVAATMAEAAKLGSSEHSTACIVTVHPARICRHGRASDGGCSVCNIEISLASLFAPCGTDASCVRLHPQDDHIGAHGRAPRRSPPSSRLMSRAQSRWSSSCRCLEVQLNSVD